MYTLPVLRRTWGAATMSALCRQQVEGPGQWPPRISSIASAFDCIGGGECVFCVGVNDFEFCGGQPGCGDSDHVPDATSKATMCYLYRFGLTLVET